MSHHPRDVHVIERAVQQQSLVWRLLWHKGKYTMMQKGCRRGKTLLVLEPTAALHKCMFATVLSSMKYHLRMNIFKNRMLTWLNHQHKPLAQVLTY